jgi:hypothetical protein
MSEVRLIAVNKAGKKAPLVLLAPEWNNTFVTGQHIDPSDPLTADNLTRDQMLGKVPLRQDQRERFPFVINPEEPMQFYNGQTFNTENPKERCILEFIKYAGKHIVAHTKSEYNRQRHSHYLSDREMDANNEVKKFSLTMRAANLVDNSSQERLNEVALYLNYAIPGLGVDIRTYSINRIKAEIFKLCQDQPGKVIDAYSDEKKNDVFILNLSHQGIIQRRENGFYDGSRYIGNTIEAVRDFMKNRNNVHVVERWERDFLVKTNQVVIKEDPNVKINEHLNRAKVLIVDNRLEDAAKEIVAVQSIKPNHPEIAVLRKKIEDELDKATTSKKLEVDTFTEEQKKYYAEIKDLGIEDLLSLAISNKIGTKASFKDFSKDDLIEKIILSVK